MIPNGKEMDWNGHHLVFESTTYQCRGCFFENRGSCPDCDEGLWVEENPSPWHTGTPTEIKGWFLFKYRAYGKFVYRTVENPVIDIFADSELEWQKIEE